MNKDNTYSVKMEIQDAEVTNFLIDLNIALGDTYEQPGRELFPQFAPHYNTVPWWELPISERLARAYLLLEGQGKNHARTIVSMALIRCARFPLGIRRSLVCLDLAYKIEPSLSTDDLYSELMFRPQDADELAEWLWQLVSRWREWNIKVEGKAQYWGKAINMIAPKGILTLLLYYYDNNASKQIGCWNKLCAIALKRIKTEQDALYDMGLDPYILTQRIEELIRKNFNNQFYSVNVNEKTRQGNESLLEKIFPSHSQQTPYKA